MGGEERPPIEGFFLHGYTGKEVRVPSSQVWLVTDVPTDSFCGSREWLAFWCGMGEAGINKVLAWLCCRLNSFETVKEERVETNTSLIWLGFDLAEGRG